MTFEWLLMHGGGGDGPSPFASGGITVLYIRPFGPLSTTTHISSP